MAELLPERPVSADSSAYVALLFEHLLHRQPRPDEVAHWAARLDAGMTDRDVFRRRSSRHGTLSSQGMRLAISTRRSLIPKKSRTIGRAPPRKMSLIWWESISICPGWNGFGMNK